MLALVSADLKFLNVDVGANGRISDGGIWNRSKFKERLHNGQLNLPHDGPFPYHIVSDDAFALNTNLMKPYPGKDLDDNMYNRIFNYRYDKEIGYTLYTIN